MRLMLGDGRTISDPGQEGIASALRTMEGRSGAFALLEDMTEEAVDLFIQATGGPDNFTVEYAEAIAQHDDEIEARHFRSRQEVMLEALVVMFQSYALRDGAWKGMVAWEDASTAEEFDAEAYAEAEPQALVSDPWARRSGCLGVLLLLGVRLLMGYRG